MLSVPISDASDYVLCDRDGLAETGGLWIRTKEAPAPTELGPIVLFVRPPSLLLVPLGTGWVLIEDDNLHAPRGEQRAGIERLVVADNIGERERVGSFEVRSGWLAVVPAVTSTDPDWRELEGCRDKGCTFELAPGAYELWWMAPVERRCARTEVELDEYWLLLPATGQPS